MNNYFLKIVTAILVLGNVGCVSSARRQNQLNTVVGLQVDVLKKIVSIRSHEKIKEKINFDPVLAEQEALLMSGLLSVIDSQEAFLQTRQKISNIRGAYVY